jgi:hypothetical protein
MLSCLARARQPMQARPGVQPPATHGADPAAGVNPAQKATNSLPAAVPSDHNVKASVPPPADGTQPSA